MTYTLNYSLINNDTAYEVTGYTGEPIDVVIPSTYLGKPVTSIGDYVFAGCESLMSIVIPNSITGIGEASLAYCTGLTSVVIPNSVITIDSGVFSNCTGLTSVVIPNSVTSIGERAFTSCDNLTSVVIPNSVTSIGGYAFEGCRKLIIYCEVTSKPSGWDSNWNSSNCPVVWGHKQNNTSTPVTYKTILTEAVRGYNNIQNALAVNNSVTGVDIDAVTNTNNTVSSLATASKMTTEIGKLTTLSEYSVTGGGLTKGTASGGGLSGGGLTKGTASGGGLSGGGLTITNNSSHDATVDLTLESQTTSGVTIQDSQPSSGYYVAVKGTSTGGTKTVTATRAAVNRAAFSQTVTRAAVNRAAFSQTVTRGDIYDNHTAGFIPAGNGKAISATSTTVSLGSGSLDSTSETVSLSAGSIASDSKSSTVTINGKNKTEYLVIPAGSCTVSGGGLSVTNSYSGTPTITIASGSDTNMENISITNNNGTKDTTYPYYFKVNAATAKLTGSTKVTRAAIKDAHTAGYIPEKTATTVISSTTSSPSVTVNAASDNEYIGLKASALKNTATTGVTYRDYSNVDSSFELVAADKYLYLDAGYMEPTKISLGQLIPNIDSDAAASHIRANYKAYDEAGNVIVGSMPNGSCTVSGGGLSKGAGSVSTTGNISLTEVSSAPTSGYYITSTGSGTVNRAAITDTHTAGYIPAKSASTVSSATSLTSNTATKYYTIPTAVLSSNIITDTSPSYVPLVTTAGYLSPVNYMVALTIPTGKQLGVLTNNGTITSFGSAGGVTSTVSISGSPSSAGYVNSLSLSGYSSTYKAYIHTLALSNANTYINDLYGTGTVYVGRTDVSGMARTLSNLTVRGYSSSYKGTITNLNVNAYGSIGALAIASNGSVTITSNNGNIGLFNPGTQYSLELDKRILKYYSTANTSIFLTNSEGKLIDVSYEKQDNVTLSSSSVTLGTMTSEIPTGPYITVTNNSKLINRQKGWANGDESFNSQKYVPVTLPAAEHNLTVSNSVTNPSVTKAANGFTASSSATSYYVSVSGANGSVTSTATCGGTSKTDTDAISVSGTGNVYIPAGVLSNVTATTSTSYVPLVTTAGYIPTRYISVLTVPSAKTLTTLTNSAGIITTANINASSSRSAYISTLNLDGYSSSYKSYISTLNLKDSYTYINNLYGSGTVYTGLTSGSTAYTLSNFTVRGVSASYKGTVTSLNVNAYGCITSLNVAANGSIGSLSLNSGYTLSNLYLYGNTISTIACTGTAVVEKMYSGTFYIGNLGDAAIAGTLQVANNGSNNSSYNASAPGSITITNNGSAYNTGTINISNNTSKGITTVTTNDGAVNVSINNGSISINGGGTNDKGVGMSGKVVTVDGGTAVTNSSGDLITTTPTFSGGSVSGSASVSATGTNVTLGSKTTTKPSSGAYITVTGSATATRAAVTYTNTAGWCSAHSGSSAVASSGSVSLTGATAYYPVTVSGGGGGPTIYTNAAKTTTTNQLQIYVDTSGNLIFKTT